LVITASIAHSNLPVITVTLPAKDNLPKIDFLPLLLSFIGYVGVGDCPLRTGGVVFSCWADELAKHCVTAGSLAQVFRCLPTRSIETLRRPNAILESRVASRLCLDWKFLASTIYLIDSSFLTSLPIHKALTLREPARLRVHGNARDLA
jgi:hypothetical protein